MKCYKKTVVFLSTDDIISSVEQSLAVKVDVPPVSKDDRKLRKTYEWLKLDMKCVLNTNRNSWLHFWTVTLRYFRFDTLPQAAELNYTPLLTTENVNNLLTVHDRHETCVERY